MGEQRKWYWGGMLTLPTVTPTSGFGGKVRVAQPAAPMGCVPGAQAQASGASVWGGEARPPHSTVALPNHEPWGGSCRHCCSGREITSLSKGALFSFPFSNLP